MINFLEKAISEWMELVLEFRDAIWALISNMTDMSNTTGNDGRGI